MTTDRYSEICAKFRWDVPPQFNIAEACCRRWAGDRARFAVYWEDETGATAACTFWDLQQQANRLSNALAALGVGRGDKVALILPQRIETIVGHIAVYQLGAVAVPLSFLFGPDALAYRLANSESKVALVDPQSLPNLIPIRAAGSGADRRHRRRRRARIVRHPVRGAAGAGREPVRTGRNGSRAIRRC